MRDWYSSVDSPHLLIHHTPSGVAGWHSSEKPQHHRNQPDIIVGGAVATTATDREEAKSEWLAASGGGQGVVVLCCSSPLFLLRTSKTLFLSLGGEVERESGALRFPREMAALVMWV